MNQITMEVFNKIYSQVSSSVSSTVSQLSGVLPGNPVTREFEASNHIASGGPGLSWKIYKGMKRSTKQEAAIFVFEKRQLDKYSKTDKELVLETLKRGVAQLTKIRHPQVLTVQHPLEESRESLAFATEPVFACLANVLGKTKNMPQPGNMSDYKLYDVEVKYGLLQIGQGLTFLHTDMRLLHRNISPESIIINSSGVWKIFGFDFCIHNTNTSPNGEPMYPLTQEQLQGGRLPLEAMPALDYMAPECGGEGSRDVVLGTDCDLYGLGMVVYGLYSIGYRPLGGSVSDLTQFRSRAQKLTTISQDKLQCVPAELRDTLRQMLIHTPRGSQKRPDAHQFIRVPYFDDVSVRTLSQLDQLLQWDNIQKSQFYRGLPEPLGKLPHRVQVQRVLPCLQRDLAQPAMVPFVLPSVLDIAEKCEQQEYIQSVLPALKPVMKIQEPVQVLLLLLQRMPLLLRLTPAQDIQLHVLPMLYRGLDASSPNSPQMHELCLNVLPTFANLLDHTSVKNHLLPRIKRLCLGTSTLSIRVNCLLCVGRLLENLDKWLVIDEVLPFLPQIPSREPAVIMGILGIYKLALTHKKLGISKEVVAGRILPFLMPLCIENGLSLQQFNALVALVKQMVQQVETEHRTKLEQLNTVQEEKRHLGEIAAASLPTNSSIPSDTSEDPSSGVFDGLGLDNFVIKSTPKPSPVPIEPKILPSAAPTTTKTTTNAKAKDLSQSLLEFSPAHSNKKPLSGNTMSNTTLNTSISSNNAWSNVMAPVTNNNNIMGRNITSPMTNNSFGQGFNTINSPLSITSSSHVQNSSFNSFGNTAMNNNTFGGHKTTNQHNEHQNWSALDNLLPSKPTGQSMLSPSYSNVSGVNQPLVNASLSNDDILDFLK